MYTAGRLVYICEGLQIHKLKHSNNTNYLHENKCLFQTIFRVYPIEPLVVVFFYNLLSFDLVGNRR